MKSFLDYDEVDFFGPKFEYFTKTAMEKLFSHQPGHAIDNHLLLLAEKTKEATGSHRRRMAQHVFK